MPGGLSAIGSETNPMKTCLIVLVCLSVVLSGHPSGAGEIHKAATDGDLAKVKELISAQPSLLDSTDEEEGMTPLHWASFAGRINVAEFLLTSKAQVNAKNRIGETPLHIAVMLDNRDLVRLLVLWGADVNAKDDVGMSPLSLATELGHSGISAILRDTKPIVTPEPVAPAPTPTPSKPPDFERKPGAPGTMAVRYTQPDLRSLPINMLTIDLTDSRISISAGLPEEGVGSGEALVDLVARHNPTAAVNGTAFTMPGYKPVGDIVIEGRRLYRGASDAVLCVGKDCRAEIVDIGKDRPMDWTACETAIGGRCLLRAGEITVPPDSATAISAEFKTKSPRAGAGINPDNQLLLANIREAVTLEEWAKILKELGCVDAIALGGGTQIAMYYRGQTVSTPSDKLANLILVYESEGSSTSAH